MDVLQKTGKVWSPDLVMRALTDPIWRTMTALGRKVAGSINVDDVVVMSNHENRDIMLFYKDDEGCLVI